MQIRLSSFLARISERYRHPPVALLVLFCLGLLAFVVDRLLLVFDVNDNVHSAILASMVGLGSAGAVWIILKSYEAQRRMEIEELRKVAELNHSLRNSLEVIAHAHYFDTDLEHKRMIMETVKKMDEKLRQLFPGKGKVA